MQKYLSILLVATLMLSGCSSDDGGTTTNDGGDGDGIPITATYRITFTPNFTADVFPTDYPSNPSFSAIVVAVHEPGKQVFTLGSAASDGLAEFAETGDSAALITDLSSQGGDDSVDFLVTEAAAGAGPTTSQSVNVTVDPEKTRISFITSLNPSPDWFVGVSSFNIVLPSNALVSEETLTLGVLDAGTDSGDTYTSPDSETTPPGTIQVLSGPPIGSTGGLSPAIGTLTITRTDL